MTTKSVNALQAVHGLVLGDALGAPASEHRTIRDPWVRQMLRRGASELDESHVLRPVIPFVLTALGTRALVGTDDSELFALAALTIIDSPSRSTQEMFERWRDRIDAPDVWTGAAQRSAQLNAASGLRPPQTGRDNPAFYDDSALPGALAAAIAMIDPADAAVLASNLATITHDGVGVQAAAIYAWTLASCMTGTPLNRSIEDALEALDCDPWLSEGIAEARQIVREARTPLTSVPALVARFAPRTYSHPGTVTETLPLAFAIVEAAGGDHEKALPLAFTITRHQDSLPSLVGALCGALGSRIDAGDLDTLGGVTIPTLSGESLSGLVSSLLEHANTA
ncbi:ADP-ribosylglycohydrolase family protein [Agreia sp. PsM10]|uniref:ADP-ribosylglycohydrolase family protein n=1 Tax=Agreia sp. PsM10 TaxID=3030533 RepID=UPI00263B2AAA|nr:ADP-ribosylglycohydrolase family protein [Agreia sp. PsM10]MDN4640035.1 ADP-ribosylglycohydrolase family protein [Agreia sp. PsM10]